MKQIRNRVLQWLIITALVVTMLPLAPSTSSAAAPVYFQFRDFSTTETSPTDVNSNIIEIAGTFNSVTNLSYKIEKIVGGKVVESSTSSTQPIITQGNSFRYPGVSIYEGLNKITMLGVNSAGNIVTGEAFVNFSNVPVITEIKLTDGRLLTKSAPLVTSRLNESITVKAPNSTEVSINGVQMFGGSGSTYLLNNLGLKQGYNKLVILAKNGTKTYEETRYLVYFTGSMTAYDVMWKTTQTPLEGDPIYTTRYNDVITAKVIMKTDTTPTTHAFYVEVVKEDGTSLSPVLRSATSASSTTSDGNSIYTIETTSSLDLQSLTNGKYKIKITDESGSAPYPTFFLPFSFRDANSPYIRDIKQAYDVNATVSPVTYSSLSSFPDKSTVSTSPFWLLLEVYVPSGSLDTMTVTAKQNGVDVPAADFDADLYNSSIGPAFVINKMPTGTVELSFKVGIGTLTDTVTRTITYIPAPSIQISSVYNGQIFTNKYFNPAVITGKLLNFNLTDSTELNSVYATLNGSNKVQLNASSGPGKIYTTANGLYKPGDFTLDTGAAPASWELLPGANELKFEGVANGVPVSTTFTIYFFSKDSPEITNIQPVQFAVVPTSDNTDILTRKRKFSDPDVKFAPTGDKQFSTTERSLDLLFNVKNLENLAVQINGTEVATATADATVTGLLETQDSISTDTIGLYIEVPDNASTNKGQAVISHIDVSSAYKMRLSEIPLPKSGSTSITIIARKNGVSVSETLTIIRDLSPYQILSPRLPNESVINSNFLKVSIKADGADAVQLGKVDMVKGSGDIFRQELKNLKPGKNTIKFTVLQGKQKINGSFEVNYAADSSITAQYKSKLPTSGKLSIFKGELALTFPKNTFLREANIAPGQDVKTVNLFDAQELYFGIADREDGRTVKRYNAVNEIDSAGTPQDGIIREVPKETFASEMLIPQSNFNYASNLFWIDAGYFKGTGLGNDYELVNAMHPYSKTDNGDDSFLPRELNPYKWMEPSQRGTISIKYDPNIVDAIARNLSIWRHTSKGWVNVGGVVDTKKKTITAPFDKFGYYVVMSLRYSFSDVGGHSYARLALETMFSRGIMIKKDNNSFGVYDNTTRGEFAQMLVKMLDVPLEYDPNNMTFDDVLAIDYDDSLWNYRYIETAVKKGFVRGRSPRLFWPNDTLTREEASVMIARALNLVKSNADMEKDKATLQKSFTDANTISLYSASAVLAIQKAGYITGIQNTGGKKSFRFEPESNLTRADAAVIIERIMKKLKKL